MRVKYLDFCNHCIRLKWCEFFTMVVFVSLPPKVFDSCPFGRNIFVFYCIFWPTMEVMHIFLGDPSISSFQS